MKIKSLIRDQQNLIPAEVEITFLPGLPQIQFLGLPDQMIRESVHRIKSALKIQGFDLPKTHQILVNIRPNYTKKSSRGVELAVAAGILWKTNQIKIPEQLSEMIVYGELGLEGDVREPEDLAFHYDGAIQILTGISERKTFSFPRLQIKELRMLAQPVFCAAQVSDQDILRPQDFLEMQFPLAQARLLEVVALGGHSVMLAGPAGSGKTTLAKALAGLMAAPSAEELRQFRKIFPTTLTWRPVIQPHHSSTPLSLIGGGVPPARGEFARAHKGLLILDEFLEFHPKAQEALREPMEEGLIRLSRSSQVAEFAACAQIVACTNLCPCGDWIPQSRVRCSRSLHRCRDYVNRLSGPLVDRFHILFFTSRFKKGESLSGQDILNRVEKGREFQRMQRRPMNNGQLPKEFLKQEMNPFVVENLLPQEFSSRRRELASLRVARTLADLEDSVQIEAEHLEEALEMAWRSFERLKALD